MSIRDQREGTSLSDTGEGRCVARVRHPVDTIHIRRDRRCKEGRQTNCNNSHRRGSRWGFSHAELCMSPTDGPGGLVEIARGTPGGLYMKNPEHVATL
jgi:hypothetical protein